MTDNERIPSYVKRLILMARDYEQQATLFEDRGLHSEALDALEGKKAAIRHLARRLSEPGL